MPESENQEHVELRVPVSVKGVVLHQGGVLLRNNDRGEWELPGGKLELGETPEECVAREIAEETDLEVQVGPLIDAWLYTIFDGRHVLILTYQCSIDAVPDTVVSPEGDRVEFLPIESLDGLNMPIGYKNSIATVLKAQT
jgi:mutator protein MutT